jgi:hypothetical protein
MSSEKHFSPPERQKYFPTFNPSLLVAPCLLWPLDGFDRPRSDETAMLRPSCGFMFAFMTAPVL